MSRAISRLSLLIGLLVVAALPVRAQVGSAPVLVTKPEAPYPVEARTARVEGEVKVAFSIEPSGRTSGVRAVSGPPVLARALQEEIRGWRFVTPLPHDAERDFVADYEFSVFDPDQPTEQSAGKPKPADAGEVVEPGYTAAVSGVVRSVDNRQWIDATPAVRNK